MAEIDRLRLHSIAQLVLVCKPGQRVVTGEDMSSVEIVENALVVVGADGVIAYAGPSEGDEAERWMKMEVMHEMDCTGKCVVPGLVDGHTHPVWSGDRVKEFAMKLAGASYMDVHKAGGGINFTVRHTRESSEEELLELFMERLDRMLRFGTTLVEAKSGYGLEVESELKMLRVMKAAQDAHAIDISATFCGAHSVPSGSTMEEATEDVIFVQLPAVMSAIECGDIYADSIDVFCEKGVFDTPSSRRIVAAGRDAGLLINFHGDELNATGSAEMGAEESATAISHLEEVTDEGIAAMAAAGTVAVLLPTTAYVLRLKPPPARAMIDAGVPVALGSDFNPNAHCLSMPHVMNLACLLLHMTLPEALIAATINSAASVGRADEYGSIEVGKAGDLLVVGADCWEHLIYEMVDPPIAAVFKRGNLVHGGE